MLQRIRRRPVTQTAPLLVAAFFSAAFLVVAVSRVLYPYDLDFIEDSMLMQARQVTLGKPVYVAPNGDYVSQVYMPLYTLLGGGLLALFGVSLWPLRLLSLAATLVTAGVVYLISRRESGNRLLALVGAGLFLAGYRLTGGWYDLARVDALFVALALAGTFVTIHSRGRAWGPPAAGLIMALAFLAKQNGLLFVVAAGVYLVWAIGWAAWSYWLVFIVVGVLPTLWLDFATHAWFSTYVFGIAYASPIDPLHIGATIGLELLGAMAPLTLGWLLLVVMTARRMGRAGLLARPWLVFIGLAIVVTIAGRASTGGHRNNLMPAYTFLCLVPAFISAELPWWQGRANWPAQRLMAVAILLQFGLTLINPLRAVLGLPGYGRFMPTAEMRQAGDRLIERIAAIDGEVWVMMHPYYAILAGKEPAVHIQMLWHARWRGRDPLPADLVARLESQGFAAIISDESEYFETDPALRDLLAITYRLGQVLPRAESPPTLSGMVVRPQVVYVPRAGPAGAE
jgi:hypothetical protein